MAVPTYFCDINNFGDALNSCLFERLAGFDIEFSKLTPAKIIGIGSILERSVFKENDHFAYAIRHAFPFINRHPLHVFSSGFGFDHERAYRSRKRFSVPLSFKRKLHCHALRGRLTLAQLESLSGRSYKDAVLGDGGLLAGLLLDASKIEKVHTLGIVPHYADASDPVFAAIAAQVRGSVILDVKQPPLDFLRQLAECELVVSTAMHPLIACDSLGIPNHWIRISEVTTSRYKFSDYYSVFDCDKEPLYLKEKQINWDNAFIEQLKAAYDIPRSRVEEIQEQLMGALQNIKRSVA